VTPDNTELPRILFTVLAAAYGCVTVYFCWRYFLRRRAPSLVCAFMPLGWVAAFGLQVERFGHEWVPVMFVTSLIVAVVSIYIIVSHEIARDKPFR